MTERLEKRGSTLEWDRKKKKTGQAQLGERNHQGKKGDEVRRVVVTKEVFQEKSKRKVRAGEKKFPPFLEDVEKEGKRVGGR